MARSRARKSSDSSWTMLIVLGLLWALGWLAEQPPWLRVVAAVSFAAVVGAWLVLFRLEFDCNYPFSSVSGRCERPARGLLGACGERKHKRWKRQAIRAALLRRPPPARPGRTVRSQRAYTPSPQSAGAAANPTPWLLQEIPHRAAALTISVVGVVAALVSMAVDLVLIANL
jgi:hypothetical protein